MRHTDARAPQLELLAWAAAHGRDLPWRHTRDPWAVLVSEVMLQQTQVDRVIPAWHAFLDRFPTVVACATSPLGEVVQLWAGLGYNRRAVNLHHAAVAAGDRLPDTLEGLLSLPGIGPYTARAVLAFAHERDVGVVDTNAARVLARWEGARLTAKQVQAAADQYVPAGEGWAWNQAVLDLGATVCLRRAPKCEQCPASGACSWSAAGRPEPDPADGSAGVSAGQSRFEGSDRQGRGRLVDALRAGPVADADLARVMGWPDDPDRAQRVAHTLVADGLARRGARTWSLGA